MRPFTNWSRRFVDSCSKESAKLRPSNGASRPVSTICSSSLIHTNMFFAGSMTGAPKLRSVQLLEHFERQQPRGIYSGAMGYMSIDGAVDLSVVIRTIVIEKTRTKVTSTGEGSDTQQFDTESGRSMTIGAGGAITWLSDPRNEWDEVMTKVRSVVG